jgi:ribokinase
MDRTVVLAKPSRGKREIAASRIRAAAVRSAALFVIERTFKTLNGCSISWEDANGPAGWDRWAIYALGMAAVTVVGSINLDIVAVADRLPVPGETVTDAVLGTHPGGKGANQALAAKRMGASVAMVGRVGADPNAAQALRLLRDDGVDLDDVGVEDAAATGVALIVVDQRGENQIVVAPGANRTLTPDHVAVADSAAVICQLEIPVDVVAEAARQATGLFCLNAAPVRPVPDSLLDTVGLLVVNEIEAEQIGERIHGGDGLVAVTLGAAGARLYRAGEEIAYASPPAVEVVDTVGAGDAFVGAMVASLTAGHGETESLLRAVTAGALATTVPGAQPSLPTLQAVEALL